jgi:hypothetical protein
MPFKYSTPIDRIIANSVLDVITGCWIWIAKVRKNNNGNAYPAMSVRWKAGRRKGKVRTIGAHRYVVAIVEGIPLCEVKVSMHRCNNTLCVNPDHLRNGTYLQNNLQSIQEGRR